MKQIGVAVVGTGWCGGIRAETLAAHPLVKSLHLAEVRQERLEEISRKTNPKSRTANYKDLLANPEIEAVYVPAARTRTTRWRAISSPRGSTCFSKSRSRSSLRKRTS